MVCAHSLFKEKAGQIRPAFFCQPAGGYQP